MRRTRVILALSVLAALLICVGFVAALDQNQASVTTFPSSQNVNPGQTVGITIIFANNSPDTLTLTNVGVHFDWMEGGGFYGFDLTNSPVTVQAGGNYPFTQPISIQVPTTATAGQHTYYVGVDGTQGTSNAPFSWDSPTSTITVGTGGVVPTGTSHPTSGGNSQGGGQDLLLYGVLSVIVVILVLVIVFLVMRMRKKPASNPPVATPEETETTESPTTPAENSANEETEQTET